MNSPSSLLAFLGSPLLGVAATYADPASKETGVYICGVEIHDDDTLLLSFPKGHQLAAGDKITLHLDNRTGVDEYDASLSVYRASYKGRVERVSPCHPAAVRALVWQSGGPCLCPAGLPASARRARGSSAAGHPAHRLARA
jgi:hypothetical protein